MRPHTVSSQRSSAPSVLVLILATLVGACATNPATGKREFSLMSEAQEIAIGQQSDAEIRREMGVYDDPELQRYVSDIGLRLASLSHRPHLPWTFTVVDHPAINAFALPGGYIYVTRGILPYLADEAELAGVLGHEIAHVTARHAAQQYTRATGGTIGLIALGIFVPSAQPFGDLASTALGVAFLKYGRDDERESDRLGMEYAAEGGWDPAAVPGFLGTLARVDELSERGVPNWLSTHPEPADRVIEAQPIAAKLGGGGERRRNADVFSRHIDGIVVGDNPEDGVVRGHVFLHPVLRIGMEFPEGWEVTNTPKQVAAREPGQPYYMLLQLVEDARGRSIEEIAVRSMNSAGFRRLESERTQLNGLDAHVGLYQGSIQGVGDVLMRAAHIATGRQVYVVAGFAPRDQFSRIDATVSTSIRSFRPLSAAEADQVRPNRLDLYTVRAGDTWQSVAARSGGLVRPSQLAIMNQYPVNEQPAVGSRIRIVVAG
ncbi:MAG: M48 family metalloprotease [Acidobacteriota bacterium]